MTDDGRPTKRTSLLIRGLAIGLFVVAAGVYGYRTWQAEQPAPLAAIDGDPGVIETIFMPLNREVVAVPTDAIGSGGGLTEWSGQAVLITNVGEFFAINGGKATKLDMAAPENGVEDFAAYIEGLDGRDPALFWFRYNDILIDERLGDRIFASFTRWRSEQNCYVNAVATAPIGATPGELAGDWETLFETSPCLEVASVGRPLQGHMAGGRMVVSPDGMILMTSGDYARDGNYDPLIIAQDPVAQYGKMLAIDPDTGDGRILSMGHSNPQGIAVDLAGNVWAVEHGRRGGDELNMIVEGRNYGWPATSLGTRYNKLTLQTISENGVHSEAYEAPIRAWLPSVAPGALTLINGFDPLWDGDLLMGTLAGEAVFRIRIREGRVLFDEEIPVGQRVRHIHMMSDGRIALYTDARTVEFLTVGQANFAYALAERYAEQIDESDLIKSEFLATVDACMMCHSLGQISGDGPRALGRVVGQPFSDSIAAKHTGGSESWSRQTLAAYLDDPAAFAPGTTMPDPELDAGKIMDHLLTFMTVLARSPE